MASARSAASRRAGLLPHDSVDQLADDVELSKVASVFLH